MTGEVAILNVAAGDTKLSFDSSDPKEVKKAAQTVKAMLRRGFVLLIEVGRNDKGPIYQRAHDFDETTHEYIVAGVAMDEETPDEKAATQAPEKTTWAKAQARPARRGPKATTRRIPAKSAKAVSVARTAGG